MNKHQDLLTTKALLTGWTLTSGGTPPAATLTRDAWSILILYSGDIPDTASLLPPGRADYDTIPVDDVDRWMKCSREEMTLHTIGERVTVGGRVGTVVGFRLEDRPPAAGPWRFRLQVVYDDGVDGDPRPASAVHLSPAPAAAGECAGWQCEDLGTRMCLVREYTRDASAPLKRKPLCEYHAEYGDRRLTVVRVLHQIPTPVVSEEV
ncbi:hypothetical protein FXF51_01505 [Nonomuraea sp. PA05]|uniref:hypothetical protein n=1 Tax=Nonomuraea sp. PA05 TaxID=2604466 RepID=UPI0011DA5CC0|nr:hypothetical protein [Nonomuraea sp. PA05]TYB71137.1 hypothetical protein FXF51_01505 [Nonomuraea sp. PA05]